MDIKTLVPIEFSRKITPMAMKDLLWNSFDNTKVLISTVTQLDNFNCKNYSDGCFSVISYADRPNTGKQPVADDVVVDFAFKDGMRHIAESACNHDFILAGHDDEVIGSWKLNHPAMVKAYQASLPKPIPADDKGWPTSERIDNIARNESDGDHYKAIAAITTLEHLGYTHNGGEQWKPPLGKQSSNDLELKRLAEFAWYNKLILDGENPVDCAIREMAEKHDIDIRSDEDKLRDAIDLAIDEANLGLDNIDRGLIMVALLASNKLNITTKGK